MAKGAAKTAPRGKKPKEQRTPAIVQVEGFGPITTTHLKRLNRFYEALVFLNGLVEACKNSGRVRAPPSGGGGGDGSESAGETPHQVLECFVNKMAQVCDSVPFGKTITALAVVVRNYDEIQYHFASNQRTADEAEVATAVVRGILDDVGGAAEADLVVVDVDDDDGISPLARRILRHVLGFHVERIRTYRRNLLDRLRRCVADCDADDFVQGPLVKQELQQFEALVEQQGHTVDGRIELSVEESISIVRGAHSLRQSEAYEGLTQRTRAGRMNQSDHWCDLQHYIGRLASYLRIPHAIIIARRRTPELFDNFAINFIPSSTPLPNPMKALLLPPPPPWMGPKRRPRDFRSARSMLHRMRSAFSDEALEAVYQGYAEDLQRCNLDGIIGSQCENPNFRPIVHCEVLLLDWLQRRFLAAAAAADDDDDDGRRHRSVPFFGEHRYIGCSKPTCRLCEYFFAANGSGVQVRRGHRNVYANWAMPDASADVSTAAATSRDKIIDKVLEKIRQDVFAALKDKVSDRKRFDSLTSSWQPTYQSLASVSAYDDDMISGMAGLSIAPREFAQRVSLQEDAADDEDKWSVGVAEDDVDEDEDEDGDGGASLSSE